jgi:RNA polymerase sigma-70 factor (ECF subfamily)
MHEKNQELEQFLMSVERRAFRIALIATKNTEDALDIVQETMFGLARRYASKPEGEWKMLFFKILQTKIRDWYRRNKVRSRFRIWLGKFTEADEEKDPFSSLSDPAAENPANRTIQKNSLKAIESALHTLPLRQQQVFLLRAWEEMSVSETAKVVGCSEGSVKTHYSRAVHTLREILEGHAS